MRRPALAVRGESQTAPRADLFRQLCVAEPRNIPDIPAVRRLDLAKNLSLSIAVHFHHGLLAALVLALAASPLRAGDIAKAVVVMEAFVETVPGQVPEAAPPRFVLMEDGQVFVGGSSRVLTAKLAGADLKGLERRLAEVRKLPGLAGVVTLGPGEARHRLLLRRGRPIDMKITGDPGQAVAALRPLADLLRDLGRFYHPSLQPYEPAQYALSARAGSLAGGCRSWPFPDRPESLGFAPRVFTADAVRGWPTGASPASVCVDDKTYVVALRPLLPGETP